MNNSSVEPNLQSLTFSDGQSLPSGLRVPFQTPVNRSEHRYIYARAGPGSGRRLAHSSHKNARSRTHPRTSHTDHSVSTHPSPSQAHAPLPNIAEGGVR